MVVDGHVDGLVHGLVHRLVHGLVHVHRHVHRHVHWHVHWHLCVVHGHLGHASGRLHLNDAAKFHDFLSQVHTGYPLCLSH